MASVDLDFARLVGTDIDASPTPYHAVAQSIALLREAGFAPVDFTDHGPGRWYYQRGGALVAWIETDEHHASSPFRVVGAHTDSPNLRIKPQPDRTGAGVAQLGVEVYGGVLANSWLDRDLGLAGRVSLRGSDEITTALFVDDRPILRIPQLAIHLDGEIRSDGLKLNPQRHLVPAWGIDGVPAFRDYLAAQLDIDPASILSWDVMAHDVTNASLGGINNEFFVSSRIDNQLSCFAAVRALIAASSSVSESIPMIGLFDHEEVGSVSATGAASPLLASIIANIAAHFDATEADRLSVTENSLVVSADGAHATHPNYADRHEPDHQIQLNGGPVVKINANQRYATDATTAAMFIEACTTVDVPVQRFVNRTDLGCGSTIGPATAGELGFPVVDAGVAQLAMHSARETAGSADLGWFRDALAQIFVS